MHTVTMRCVAVSMFLALGCFAQRAWASDDCVDLKEALFEKLLQQAPFNLLPEDVLKLARKFFENAKGQPVGKVCLVGATEGTPQCNSQTDRTKPPQFKKCCKFKGDPSLTLLDLPSEVKVVIGVAPADTGIDVKLTAKCAENAYHVNRNCVEPTCTDDDARCDHPILHIDGTVKPAPGTSAAAKLQFDLAKKLKLKCTL